MTFTATAIKVIDGDTLDVTDGNRQRHRIRLAGIDAPERKQAFGKASKHSLYQMVNAKPLTAKCTQIEHRRDSERTRLICTVYVAGKDVNWNQVQRGYAWHYTQYAHTQSSSDRGTYAAAQRTAQHTRAGLWQEPTPTPPWYWRHAQQ